jgi:Uma2 family endonuclease
MFRGMDPQNFMQTLCVAADHMGMEITSHNHHQIYSPTVKLHGAMNPKILQGKAALDAIADAPENAIAEVLAGVLHTSPRPRIRHARAASVLGAKLWALDRDDEPGGWIFLDEPELHLGVEPDIVVPDLAGWRRERMPCLPDDAFLQLAPDWVCEVLSPSTERIDRVEKRAIYAREGVSHLWFVEPGTELLEVFELDRESYRIVGTWAGQDVIAAPPFAVLALALGDLWLT